MLTIEEAILHAEEVAIEQEYLMGRYDAASGYARSGNESIRTESAKKCEKCAEEHRQLAAYLRELAERRKAPEIVRCGECKYFEDADFGGYCNNEKTYAIKTDSEFGCILGERRTDG